MSPTRGGGCVLATPLTADSASPRASPRRRQQQQQHSPAASSSTLPTPDNDDTDERCSICLTSMRDRTAAGACGHEFCFTCIGVWANQGRRCPLCAAPMGDVLLHDLDADVPTKFFLPPLPDQSAFRRRRASPARKDTAAPPPPGLARRRDIYERGLWALHVASNAYTAYRANPSPRELAADSALAARAQAFLSRELLVWAPPDDVAALAEHLVGLLRAVDVRSDAAVRVLAPLVGGTYDHAPEHLAHELYAFLRSPFATLEEYDGAVQYPAEPASIPDAPRRARSASVSTIASSQGHWSPRDRSRSRSRSGSRSPRGPDSYAPPPARGERRWDEADSWVDPEYAAWLEAQRRPNRRADRSARRREQRLRARERAEAEGRRELLPEGGAFERAAASAGLAIKGTAERRESLLARLRQAKVERQAAASASASASPEPAAAPAPAPAPGDNERRAKELKERLIAERKAKNLREHLLARKRAKTEAGGDKGPEAAEATEATQAAAALS
ncbi:hypothetical protein Q8F55_004319 [Vanrija albida]|uniref:RING-type E3 ubiquitin transferase n=1 Tax=Vanrija albida TaxID=181172 RepID=A0ABR3Q7I9_9TREE